MAGPWEKYSNSASAPEAGPWAKYGGAAKAEVAPAAGETNPVLIQGQNYINAASGALKAATDIGSTLLSPIDKMIDAAKGDRGPNISDLVTGSQPISRNQERRQALADFFNQTAQPKSAAFKTGELAGDVAGTAGVGGLLGKGAQALGAAPKVIAALESGGFSLGKDTAGTGVSNLLLRTIGGATTGGAQAVLINPDSAKTGAIIGGAMPGGVKLAGMVGSGLRSAGEHILGAMTGTSAETVREAFKSGMSNATDFLENMRGNIPFEEVVDRAKQGLRNMRAERGAQYRSGMVDIKADKSVLDMEPIINAVKDIQATGNFKGKIINEKSAGTIEEIANKVNDWAKSAPEDFHTPEGLDALKQAIGDIRDSTQFGTPARRVADNVYNAVKSQIQAQAPTYSKVMADYSTASDTLQQIEKGLSLGDKTSKDTAIRKLQSLMRNNAQSNFGNRLQLGQTLEEKGGVSLKPAIAGQSMSAILPRGMVGAIEKVGMAGAPFVAPHALVAAPLTSPRLVGETLYGAGRVAGGASEALNVLGEKLGIPKRLMGSVASIMEEPATRSALMQSLVNQSSP